MLIVVEGGRRGGGGDVATDIPLLTHCIAPLLVVHHVPLPVCLAKFLEGPPAFNNKAMTNYLQTNYFSPPASTEYQLSGHDGMYPNFQELVLYIKEYFKNKVRNVQSLHANQGLERVIVQDV